MSAIVKDGSSTGSRKKLKVHRLGFPAVAQPILYKPGTSLASHCPSVRMPFILDSEIED